MPELTLERLNLLVSTLLSGDTASGSEETVVHQSGPPMAGTDQSLQTDEEQILQLFADHDQRLWQGDIVRETGFSESKTSRLLCAMEEEGKISRGRVGRQKVVYLPDSDE